MPDETRITIDLSAEETGLLISALSAAPIVLGDATESPMSTLVSRLGACVDQQLDTIGEKTAFAVKVTIHAARFSAVEL